MKSSTKMVKGTPRKRPYDVKRKLRAAGRRDAEMQRLITREWGPLRVEDGVYTCDSAGRCLVSAYLVGKPAETEDLVTDAGKHLGLDREEVWEIIHGYDCEPVRVARRRIAFSNPRWFDIGVQLREELLGA